MHPDNLLIFIQMIVRGLCVSLFKDLFTFCNSVIDRSYKVECILRKVIHLSVHDHIESSDRLFDRNQYSFQSCKLLRNEERLRKETLNSTCSTYDQFVLF